MGLAALAMTRVEVEVDRGWSGLKKSCGYLQLTLLSHRVSPRASSNSKL
jgi:hypothetical protein